MESSIFSPYWRVLKLRNLINFFSWFASCEVDYAELGSWIIESYKLCKQWHCRDRKNTKKIDRCTKVYIKSNTKELIINSHTKLLLYFFLFFFTAHRVYIKLFTQFYSVICRDSIPGGLGAGTLTTRPPHLLVVLTLHSIECTFWSERNIPRCLRITGNLLPCGC